MPTFSVFDAVLLGALGMAATLFTLVVAAVLVWKVWPVLREATYAMSGLSERLKGVGPSLEGLRQEMAFMRQMTAPGSQVGSAGSPEPPEGFVPPAAASPKSPVPFPAPNFDRFTVAPPEPDAEKEDTVMEHLNQSDEDLARQEVIEEMRDRGQVVEDDDKEHEAIQVEST